MGLSDTMSFLKSLAELNTLSDSGKNAEKRQMRERMAAANLFNWQVSYIKIFFSWEFLNLVLSLFLHKHG